jgi:hypothetical protein
MTNLHLPAETKEEVLAEVANHLEDRYERLLSSGLNEEEAVRRTLECIENWNALESSISRERRGIMSTFGKQFTLPSRNRTSELGGVTGECIVDGRAPVSPRR